MKPLKLIVALFYLLPFGAVAQAEISAVATDASCTGDGRADGTISITVKNVSQPLVYAVVKSPYDPANIIASSVSKITHLEPGDYFYGYYENNIFIKAATTIKVGSTYSSVSPSITRFDAENYTYCASEPNPLGSIGITINNGNPPYTIALLNASDNSIVQNIQTSSGYSLLKGMPSGSYKVRATDNCGTVISPPTIVNLAPNVTLKANDIILEKGEIGNVDLVYNIPGNVCSGISSASLPNGLLAVATGGAHINPLISPRFSGTQNYIYKLEIQNGSGWNVYDNLTYNQVRQSFPLPSDRSKWGIVRLSATYCNLTKTVELDYGASSIGIPRPFTNFEFSIEDDPLNNNCNDTGQVLLKNVPKDQGGCLPYTVEVTDNSTGIKNTYTITAINSLVVCKLDIGKNYTIKVTDHTGIETTAYTFFNRTSNTSPVKTDITDPKNVFIDPNYFSPDKDIRAKVQFFTGPSGKFFGRSALAVYPPMATPGFVGLQGEVTVSLVSGPSPLAITKGSVIGLGNQLLPGTYVIRIQDSGCFNEVFDVVLDSYFTKIEITKVSAVPSPSVCDRYIKNVTVQVSGVGKTAMDDHLKRLYGIDFIDLGFLTVPPGASRLSIPGNATMLRTGIFNFSFEPDVAGNYEIGLSRRVVMGILNKNQLWENTSTAALKVTPNFPVFDLSKSGGIVCSGNATGELHTKVDQVTEAVTYFIKKETDTDFPSTGQTDPVFRGLTSGNYIVKAKTTCYEVLQPLILRSSFSKLISGESTVCIGGNIKLSVIQIGPVNSIKWTLPDGTQIDAAELNINNVTAAQIGTYKVEISSLGGCYFTESINVRLGGLSTPTGNATQQFCAAAKAKVADLVITETDVIWYDALTGGNIIPSATLLIDGKTYYGTAKSGTCESTDRLAVTVSITDPKTPTGAATQQFCAAVKPTVGDLAVSGTGIIWYDAVAGGAIIPSTTLLIDGKTYYGTVKSGTCESTNRLAVTVSISDPKTPTGAATQQFCAAVKATVANLVASGTGIIWYDASTAGNIIPSATLLIDGKTYYGTAKSGTCESTNRLAVTVSISDPKTPTGAATQQFCAAAKATVADLVASGTGIIWYDASTGGNIIPSTTRLIDGKTYYGAAKSGTCESTNRLAVTVSISDPKTPTGTATQHFCADKATVADLAASGTGIIWYDAPTGGNIIPSTTLLIDGKIYYGAAKSGTCESTNRLAVTAIVKNNFPSKEPDWHASTCVTEKVTYNTVPGMSSYNWHVSKEGTIVNGGHPSDDFVTVLWNHIGKGSIEVNYIDETKCDPLVIIHFSIDVVSCSKPDGDFDGDIALKKTINDPMANIGQQIVFTITAENLGEHSFNDVQIRDILPSGYIYTSSKTSSGDYNVTTGIWNLPNLSGKQTETLTITAKVKSTGNYLNIVFLENSTPEDLNPHNNKAQAGIINPEVIVFNMVSPNGDGRNDYFEIRGLERFPSNTVTIYNSWGVKVFETHNYGANNNFFRGISEGRATVNKHEGLPPGTYFYVLSYGNGALMTEKSGYLHLTFR
ncbi:gliding motility-associated C-terminal domain-containing protein [Flavobacterium sp.]|uniref:Ig-like domain-containing protein n=1 Tax=Flavobacterium sp. TaxID=239 RepID=UPI0025C5C967|nr:gliding motility-associated C-terminal domain-containing protein [Flavobacterium sp.]